MKINNTKHLEVCIIVNSYVESLERIANKYNIKFPIEMLKENNRAYAKMVKSIKLVMLKNCKHKNTETCLGHTVCLDCGLEMW